MISPESKIDIFSLSTPVIEVEIPFFSGSKISIWPSEVLVEISSLSEAARELIFIIGSSSISMTLKSSLLVIDFSPKKVKTRRLYEVLDS